MKVLRNENAAFRFSAMRWERENKRPRDRMACLSTGTEFRIPLPFFYKCMLLRMEESFHPLLTLNVNLHEAKA